MFTLSPSGWRNLILPVHLPVDTSQQDIHHFVLSYLAIRELFGVNDVLRNSFHQTEMQVPLVKETHPINAEVSVEFPEVVGCATIPTNLDELKTDLNTQVRNVTSQPRQNQRTWVRVATALFSLATVSMITVLTSCRLSVPHTSASFTWHRLRYTTHQGTHQ